jgi:GTPase SAR1 family protein
MNRKKYLTENPKYIEVLEKIVEYERNNQTPQHAYIDDTEKDSVWEYKDVGVQPQTLYQLETNGFLERMFDSQSTTAYSLVNREEIASVVDELSSKYDGEGKEVMHDFPDREDLEDMDIFADVVGYEDVKWLMRKALSSDDIVNILLVGPPGSGKTVFLRCIRQLKGASFISGKRTTEAGFTDEMFESEPRFMCIDELDDMDSDDQEALADYTEEGVIVETKGNNKRREMKTNTKTFAAANEDGDILPQIENRFTDLHFDQYSLGQFKKVCERILPRDYGTTEEHARDIAAAIWDIDGFANVRKAEDVAALSDGEDPQKVVGVLDSYSADRARGGL